MVSELEILVGSEVSGVAFIRDYVEIFFDGPILRIFVGPVVEFDATQVVFPGTGSRDHLCRLIGRQVRRAQETSEELQVSFDGRAQLRMPLRSGDSGAEAAHLVPWVHGRLDTASMTIWESQAS
jgi:hypothetical protein